MTIRTLIHSFYILDFKLFAYRPNFADGASTTREDTQNRFRQTAVTWHPPTTLHGVVTQTNKERIFIIIKNLNITKVLTLSGKYILSLNTPFRVT